MTFHSKSILQEDTSICIVCGKPYAQRHHIMYGTANRNLSEKYGLTCGLCYNHHTGQMGVHNGNRELDMKLKRMAQERFIEAYPELDFLAIFGRNYL
jgi:hypothetical protein